MNDLKWADVAHMYAKSNLSIMVGQFDHGAEMGMIFSKGLHENCEWADHGMWCQVKNGAFISEWGSHKPILRHLEDMTEDHAKDMYSMMFGDPREVLSQWKRSLSWAKDFIAIGKFEPRLTVWLLSQGFDLFGLIESEQAIRRPKD